MRKTSFVLLLALAAGAVNAQSQSQTQNQGPQESDLRVLLEQIARQSNQGTPRRINEDLVDQGYTVKGTTLVNLIAVSEQHSDEMRNSPQQVRAQLKEAVCANEGFRKLLDLGAELRYEFIEDEGNSQILTERFQPGACQQ